MRYSPLTCSVQRLKYNARRYDYQRNKQKAYARRKWSNFRMKLRNARLLERRKARKYGYFPVHNPFQRDLFTRSQRSRNVAIARLGRAAKRGSVLARNQLRGIRSRARYNLQILRKRLLARATIRKFVRRRVRGRRTVKAIALLSNRMRQWKAKRS